MLSVGRVAVVVPVLLGLVACGDDRPPREAAPPPEPTAAPAPAPESPRPADIALGSGFTMGRPVVDGRISLVPVYASAAPELAFVTLTDALATGKVTAHEQNGEWAVDAVKIVNTGETPVFAMNGELVVEANQDRVIAENAVIAPGETRMVEVRCVEAKRSSGSTTRFRAGGAIAEPSIRRRLRYQDQTEVWAQVNVINARLGLSPPTETYRFAAAKQTAPGAKARRDALVASLDRVPGRERMVGLALAVDGKVIALDRFATPALYRAVEPRLIASYLPAELDDHPTVAQHQLTPDDVRVLAQPSAGRDTDANTEFLRPIEDQNSRD